VNMGICCIGYMSLAVVPGSDNLSKLQCLLA
jgi:hypothetical protein